MAKNRVIENILKLGALKGDEFKFHGKDLRINKLEENIKYLERLQSAFETISYKIHRYLHRIESDVKKELKNLKEILYIEREIDVIAGTTFKGLVRGDIIIHDLDRMDKLIIRVDSLYGQESCRYLYGISPVEMQIDPELITHSKDVSIEVKINDIQYKREILINRLKEINETDSFIAFVNTRFNNLKINNSGTGIDQNQIIDIERQLKILINQKSKLSDYMKNLKKFSEILNDLLELKNKIGQLEVDESMATYEDIETEVRFKTFVRKIKDFIELDALIDNLLQQMNSKNESRSLRDDLNRADEHLEQFFDKDIIMIENYFSRDCTNNKMLQKMKNAPDSTDNENDYQMIKFPDVDILSVEKRIKENRDKILQLRESIKIFEDKKKLKEANLAELETKKNTYLGDIKELLHAIELLDDDTETKWSVIQKKRCNFQDKIEKTKIKYNHNQININKFVEKYKKEKLVYDEKIQALLFQISEIEEDINLDQSTLDYERLKLQPDKTEEQSRNKNQIRQLQKKLDKNESAWKIFKEDFESEMAIITEEIKNCNLEKESNDKQMLEIKENKNALIKDLEAHKNTLSKSQFQKRNKINQKKIEDLNKKINNYENIHVKLEKKLRILQDRIKNIPGELVKCRAFCINKKTKYRNKLILLVKINASFKKDSNNNIPINTKLDYSDVDENLSSNNKKISIDKVMKHSPEVILADLRSDRHIRNCLSKLSFKKALELDVKPVGVYCNRE